MRRSGPLGSPAAKLRGITTNSDIDGAHSALWVWGGLPGVLLPLRPSRLFAVHPRDLMESLPLSHGVVRAM